MTMTQKPPALIYVIALTMSLFIGILVFAYVVTKQANPVMLDEHGQVLPK